MAVKRLGKGLNALIPEMSTEDEQRSEPLGEVEVSRVKPNPFQPRETFDPVAFEELKLSIAEKGVIQPISVRVVDAGYELISGERRLRAVQALGLNAIPAYILQVDTDEEMIELSLIENIQRENLNPIDEANGYNTLLTKCNLTQDEVAKKVGKDRSTITNSLRMLKLPKVIQESLIKNDISAGHARAFLSLPEHSDQIDLWKKTLKKKYSVRQVESLVSGDRKKSGPKKASRQPTVDPFLLENEDKLRTAFGTQVRINENSKGDTGKIEIEYYSRSELERILELLQEIS
jgi:ParB family chromosome partitioning protein